MTSNNNNNIDGIPYGLQVTNRETSSQQQQQQPLQRKASFLKTILGRGFFKGNSSNLTKEEMEAQKKVINRSAVISNGAQ